MRAQNKGKVQLGYPKVVAVANGSSGHLQELSLRSLSRSSNRVSPRLL